MRHGRNQELYDDMIRRGFKWKAGPRHCHFVDAEGNYVCFPTGYITGPSYAIDSPEPHYISVIGPDGWMQKSGTTSDGLIQWAIETQANILAGIEVTE